MLLTFQHLGKITVAALVLTLVGCAMNSAHKLGMTTAEWESLSREEQQVRLSQYRATNELLKTRQSEQASFDLNHDTPVRITIEQGTAMMPPFEQAVPYEPVRLTLTEGHCDQVMLREQGGKSKVPLRACLLDDTFLLDPSAYDKEKQLGSIRIHASPVWQTGFSYFPITTTGLVRLHRARVTLEIMKQDETFG